MKWIIARALTFYTENNRELLGLLPREKCQGSSFEQVPPKQSHGRGNFYQSKGGNNKGILLYNGPCVGRRSGGIRSRKLWTVWQLFCLKAWPRSLLPNPNDSHFNFGFDMCVKLPQQTILPHHKHIFFQQWQFWYWLIQMTLALKRSACWFGLWLHVVSQTLSCLKKSLLVWMLVEEIRNSALICTAPSLS